MPFSIRASVDGGSDSPPVRTGLPNSAASTSSSCRTFSQTLNGAVERANHTHQEFYQVTACSLEMKNSIATAWEKSQYRFALIRRWAI
jgi:hypothetical protein